MLVDVLSSDNYLYVNVGAIKILGLNNAIYCSELLRIYRKASRKNRIDANGFFKVDRTYLKSRTSLTTSEQIECENNLSKVKLIEISKESLDTIKFDDKMYMSIVSQEDAKFLTDISKKLKTKKSSADREVKKERIITALKNNITLMDDDIHLALENWIDVMFANPKVVMTKATVAEFENALVDYCKTDKQKTLRLIEIATSQGWKNCLWAIKTYEQEQTISKSTRKRLTSKNVASNDDVGDVVF